MAPSAFAVAADGLASHAKRAYCYSYGYTYTCNNRWYDWGRWVVLAGVVVVVTLILFSCAFTARRRRRRGAQPMYGTGWMAPSGKVGEQQQHQMNNYQQGYDQGYMYQPGYQQGYGQQGQYNAPLAYGQQPQNTGTTFNPNDGYYGHQQHQQHQQQHQQQYDVQQPQSTYQRDNTSYAPPAGPPPGK
ncbi:uncharacterized protein UV8b_02006 [Ustilaginoidea virens]|uniref:Chitin synthesis regulation, Congo red resistance, RCR protein n=1 Tax=Ustilaginoidea virens TaxID=1159556 RepID=A0A8E5HLP4_USTVR|nr:uncharacterized protein UV8b_02006 [Ustilaginoidea virens]QUC17765.1 hypothetical protein UV8b_02006 [Ustilaginoidea virens]